MTAHQPPALPLPARILLLILLLSPLALAIPRLIGPHSDDPPTNSAGKTGISEETGEPPVTAAPASLAHVNRLRTPILGFAINAHHIADLDAYLEAVDSIHDLGANTLLVVTPMYQETVRSTEIRRVPAKCATDEQLIAILQHGKQRGLQTFLMPIVLIEHAETKEWRGVIDPAPRWDEWWRSYTAFIDRFLSIAQRADVDIFSIGSELNVTEDQIDRWETIAARVRKRFDGVLTYSANWDRYDRVEFWPLVDVISVSSYFELERDEPGASEEAIVRAWAPLREDLIDHARRWQRPLMLSEVGYPSLPWANAHPWNYVDDGQEADHEAQARCWRAFFAAWSATLAGSDAPVIGFCGYRWDPYHRGGARDTGYGIRGKPAQKVIRRGILEVRGM